MAIKTYKPTTPSRRFYTNVDNSDITAKASVRSLLVKLPAAAGRNNNGRITSRHKEAGAKKLYRIIDSNVTNSVLPEQLQRSSTIRTVTVVSL